MATIRLIANEVASIENIPGWNMLDINFTRNNQTHGLMETALMDLYSLMALLIVTLFLA
jgi:hypothetical protein